MRGPRVVQSIGICFLMLAGASGTAAADIQVAPLIGDHMVVQQGRPIRLWGLAAPGETVRASLASSSGSARADAGGRWRIDLPPLPAGGPHTLTMATAAATAAAAASSPAAGAGARTFSDVWVGEVWLASGQSNMELPLWRSNGAEDATAGGCAGLHLFNVVHASAGAPATRVDGQWETCNAQTALAFSAVAYHFGRDLRRTLGVPIGLVLSAYGGTPAEAWTPRAALAADPALAPLLDPLDRTAADPSTRDALARVRADWEKKNFHQDTGNRGEALGWARPGRVAPQGNKTDAKSGTKGWTTMELPRLWESTGLKMDGAVWFRREVEVPAAWVGRDLDLSLGALDDFDVSYWNGRRVGATGEETPQYWMAQRHYVVPARLVKAGSNTIAVRVFDHFGNGGFAGPPAALTVGPSEPGAATIPLTGAWLTRVERKLEPAVVDFGSRPKIPGPDEPTTPTVLWNAMVAPLVGLPVAGTIWYQGESNAERAHEYRTLFPVMIRAWRDAWQAAGPDRPRDRPQDVAMPFLFVQLPNFAPAAPAGALGASAWAELRDAQAGALRLPATAMAVALDVGERGDVHPRNKQEIGRRLALLALKQVYRKDVTVAVVGPTFDKVARAGAALRVGFTAAGGALLTSDGGPPRGFIVAGADRVWHVADGRIEGNTVVVSSPEVPEPIAVRYAWADDPPNTLRNQVDLPAAPFRSDDWADVTTGATSELNAGIGARKALPSP